mmetsp:Transcript_23342/g.34254  ORF Transcript_23342/g.34254 Transcript_23342/m.34254 type:complete len:109 (-) Transcript_23342:32-358(-)
MHLLSGGGFGLPHLPTSFTRRLERLVAATPQLVRLVAEVTHTNMERLLTYYIPPPPEKVETKLWLCDACRKGFGEEQEAFTKFHLQFCSPKCLTAGRKATNNWADIQK